MLLFEIVGVLETAKVKYALVGGYALALHGFVRATMDVDLVLNIKLEDYEKAEKALADIGLTSRLPVKAADIIRMRKEYIQNRNLIAWSFVDYQNPSRQVDILITQDLKDLRTQNISVSGRKVRVVTLPQLREMKLEAGREQDLLDVRWIDEKNSKK